jgi:hypothetical protein
MVRVHVLVEGEAEETFARDVLTPHFAPHEIHLLPRRLGKPKHKRGICGYPRAQREILITLKQDVHAFCTTMFDYYGMPPDWPKREEARRKPFAERSVMVEEAILVDISGQLGGRFNRSRFIPYVQMHEFEALLFSDPQVLAEGLELADDTPVRYITNQFTSPEEINDSQQTAPSKRIMELKPRYGKVTDGVLISQKIGLTVMRAQCPHFNQWIGKLEALAERG